MKPAIVILATFVLAAMALMAPSGAYPYLFQLAGSGSAAAPEHWDFTAFPVTWNINPTVGSNISGSVSAADAITTAFATWTSAPNAALTITRGPDSTISSEAQSPRGINLICFVCMDGDFNLDAQTLAVTLTTSANGAGEPDGHGGVSRFAGQILKADILFNSNALYSTSGGSAQDLQTVATHEVGHFLGLAHSGVVRAVMFPFASSIRQLSYDDVAGLAVLYPKGAADVPTGTISGTVRLGSGVVFGAHVFAESVTGAEPFASTIRKSPIGALTLPDGSYVIQGLPVDSYVITAEPLDDPVTNSGVNGYAKTFGQPAVQTNFTTRWH